MIDLLSKYTREELYNLFNSFTKKGDIHKYFGITDNSSGVRYIKTVADEIGFDLNTYVNRKKRYCLLCGKELTRGQHKFCCNSHAATYNNKLREKKHKDSTKNKSINTKKEEKSVSDNKQRPVKTCKCQFCGKETPYRKGKQFCSSVCANHYFSEKKYLYFKENPEEFCRGNYVPRYAIREHILQEQNNVCAICNSEQTHNGKPLVFVLDHIDGDASNNRRENLRMICPNCDSQLDTYKSKNKNSTRRNYWKEHIISKFLDENQSQMSSTDNQN